VGEALISFLDEKGHLRPVERGLIVPPGSRMGPTTEAERQQVIRDSLLCGRYEQRVDRESAYEILKVRAATSSKQTLAEADRGL